MAKLSGERVWVLRGLKSAFPNQMEFLGVYSTLKKAKLAVKNGLKQKVKWDKPLEQLYECTTQIPGWKIFWIDGVKIDFSSVDEFQMQTIMSIAMNEDERNRSTPFDDYLGNL